MPLEKTISLQNSMSPKPQVSSLIWLKRWMSLSFLQQWISSTSQKKLSHLQCISLSFLTNLIKQDLSDIWQNLPPRLGENFEEAEATISHPLFSDHFLSSVQREEGQQTPTGGTIDTEIRWMIFKVKQRAETDYSSKVVSGVSNKTLRKRVLFPKSPQERKENIDSLLSYNWPYDYFSLVELVKLDAEFTFADIDPNNPDALGRKGNPNKDKAKKTIQSRLKQPAPPAPPPGITPEGSQSPQASPNSRNIIPSTPRLQQARRNTKRSN